LDIFILIGYKNWPWVEAHVLQVGYLIRLTKNGPATLNRDVNQAKAKGLAGFSHTRERL
jgi:hypothetical protein